jgi:hypothetical protein
VDDVSAVAQWAEATKQEPLIAGIDVSTSSMMDCPSCQSAAARDG